MSALTDCASLPDHIELTCTGDYKKGAISALAILKSDHGITDFTSAAQWTTAINSGKVKIIKKIKATYPEATPVEGENPVPCGSENILDFFDHSLTLKDFNVDSLNDDFYEKLNLTSGRSLAWFYCEEDEIRVAENVSFTALPASSPESNREKQFYNVKANWSSKPDEFPTLYAAPTGIFT